MGIGAVPDAVLKALHGHKELGIHTEMFSDGLVTIRLSHTSSSRVINHIFILTDVYSFLGVDVYFISC